MLKKIGYVIIALLFGGVGLHNFIEGNNTSGFAKLIITVCSWFLLSGWILSIISTIVAIWILFDILQYCLYGQSYDVRKLFQKKTN